MYVLVSLSVVSYLWLGNKKNASSWKGPYWKHKRCPALTTIWKFFLGSHLPGNKYPGCSLLSWFLWCCLTEQPSLVLLEILGKISSIPLIKKSFNPVLLFFISQSKIPLWESFKSMKAKKKKRKKKCSKWQWIQLQQMPILSSRRARSKTQGTTGWSALP